MVEQKIDKVMIGMDGTEFGWVLGSHCEFVVMGERSWGRGGKGQEVEGGHPDTWVHLPLEGGQLRGVVFRPGCPGPLGQGSALSVSRYGVPVVSGGIWGTRSNLGPGCPRSVSAGVGVQGRFGDSGGI